MGSIHDESPLRVLMVTPFGTSGVTGGAEKWLTGMLTHARDIQWRVLLLQPGPLRAELESAGLEVDVHPTGTSVLALGRAVLRTATELRRWRPDVVVTNGIKAQLVVALAALTRGTPTVWAKHDYSFDRTLARPVGWLTDVVVTTAEGVASAVRHPDVVVIHPPAQAQRPSDRESARLRLSRLGLSFDDDDDDRPILAMAGRLVPYKGVDDAIAALAAPGAEQWRLAIIGDEDYSAQGERERLAQLAEHRGVSARVTFVPPVEGLSDLFAAFDALAVLTKPAGRRTPGREGFGMTAFEAMQAGIPVVAVSGSPVARRLAGGGGLTVAPGAPEEVAAALGQLSDPAARRAMGRTAQHLVRHYAGVDEAVGSFTSVLRAAASRPRWAAVRRHVRLSPREHRDRPPLDPPG